ncbi:MAG: phosphopantetheine-binding protein [Bacillota bacterium]|nr:phosphopantetheine-binding protein [Bacillota bacterium]
MEKLIEILNEIDDTIDYENEKKLIDARLINSMAVVELVGEIEEEFDVEITASELKPENFNSVEAMMKMITRLRGE